jgi:cell division protein FtsZ
VTPRPAQPRLAPLEPEERSGNSKEDDLLDIPAFLRRQEN